MPRLPYDSYRTSQAMYVSGNNEARSFTTVVAVEKQ